MCKIKSSQKINNKIKFNAYEIYKVKRFKFDDKTIFGSRSQLKKNIMALL